MKRLALQRKRQEKFIDCFTKHIECLNEGVTDLDDYQKVVQG